MSGAELTIRTKATRRTFVAEDCQVEAAWVHAEGRWRHRHGDDFLYSGPHRYSWPARVVERIKWTGGRR